MTYATSKEAQSYFLEETRHAHSIFLENWHVEMDLPEDILIIQCSRGTGPPQSLESGVLDCAEVVQQRCPSAELKLGSGLLGSYTLRVVLQETRPGVLQRIEETVPPVARIPSMILPEFVPVVQHSEEEWNNMRSLITNLYINQQLPLGSVIRRMATELHFKASERMYKRRLKKWKLWKNQPSGPVSRKEIHSQAGESRNTAFPSNQSPRYLRQNDCDEEMHTILDQITPYFHESFRSGRWTVGSDYLYDDFTLYIGQAMSCFVSGNHDKGGHVLRQAFISAEYLILDQKVWGLERIMYAVNGLVASRCFDIPQVLLTHLGNLAAVKFQRLHPVAQVLRRFALLLVKDPDYLTYSMLTTWRLCHRVTNNDNANSLRLYMSRKLLWQDSRHWPARQLTERSLQLFLQKVEGEFGEYHDISLVIYDELLAIYAQFHDEVFERTALEMSRRIEWRLEHGATSPELFGWKRNTSFELASFYYDNGNRTRAIENLEQVTSDWPANTWELEQFKMLQSWKEECRL